MFIIVGLGNPGKKYSGTRHNIGFDIIDLLAKKHGIKVTKVKHKSHIGEGRIAGEKVLLVKPQTYMNLSGDAVRSLCEFYKVDLSKLLVVYDDIDVAKGKIRIRKTGSAGSHNGMKNIIYLLKEKGFPRLRFGVGKPERGDLADYVLQRFTKEEVEMLQDSVDKSVLAVEEYIANGIDNAMNKYNS